MIGTACQKKATIRLPLLAAATLVFVCTGTNARLDAATIAWPSPEAVRHDAVIATQQERVNTAATNASESLREKIHVLSPHDAALYHAAFAAQDISDWRLADDALARVQDKRLIGHVLADRYLRRGLSL
ncbi:MAG: hypothetical protein KGI97_07315, partial [Alphaproteobacteria bacterium]|nr:hypothetical protein [Alphaproteobacteria bacterium]